MKTDFTKKILSFVLTLCFLLSSFTANIYAVEDVPSTSTTAAAEKTTEISEKEKAQQVQKTLEEQKKELEEKLKMSQEKLDSFAEDAKATEEYINALDEKIGYLNEELTLLDNEILEAQKKVEELDEQIKPLKKQLDALKKEYAAAQEEFNTLNDDFHSTYNAYCLRLRAMYISGSTSILAALLTSKDISQFLSRFEMIRAVSRSDTKLLKKVNSEMEKIVTQQDGLNERKAELEQTKGALDSKQKEQKAQQEKIEKNQQSIASKKITLSEDRAKSDALLAEYSEKTQMYTEFRNEDEELIKSVENEIDDLIKGLKTPDEVTTAKAGEHVTSHSRPGSTTGSLFSRSNAALSLTYPVPHHYAVSQSFGHYRNGKAHGGIDYPCPVGSKIVAAQKGIVVTVKRLNYSYGYYVMIYHGTDAKGRKVVTLYAHNSSLLVSVGQTVTKGQQIAKSGSTGNSTGPHCHFELILDGTRTNPKNYLSK